ncbi:sulfite exporter TauE/SafE family protein [Acanthopleuribacter pedis]|uniref:Probable membrane transporter protein n=1 Tax=Acanthopleuribacter pedis TaxID=442870 RepID=A0A8J7Q5F0_9BACT|nr:sulfite exporter TauE/SafE family protein [Acanthopleuribacter pedis]MBO1316954.1 sulfite exporter TauE/SafE family protein [Acanthopleuribacter pedis]
MIVVGLVLSLLVGVSLGLLGGGGSILTLPILLYVLGVEVHAAIAMSLFVVGVTAVVGAVQHARRGNVHWRTGWWFSVGGMGGAFLGGKLGAQLSPTLLLSLFAALMLVTAGLMLRGKKTLVTPGAAPRRQLVRVLLEGFVVGGFTGMIGAGGGFLVVPALVLLGGLPMREAVGTSLMVIALKSFAGLAGYLSHIAIDWALALGVSAAAVAGSFIGARAVHRVAPDQLRRVFAWFVLAMGVFVLVKEWT